MESAAVNVADASVGAREPERLRVSQKSQASKSPQNSQESAPHGNGKRRFLFVLRFLAGAIVAFAVAYLSARYYLVSMTRQGLQPDTSWRIVVLRLAVLMPLPLIVCSWATLGWHRVNDWLRKWRWALGGVVIAFCTVFKISGSSINAWHWYLQSGNLLNQTILGYPRLSRNDEFAVQTTFASSQSYNGYGLENSLLGGIDSTNMFIVKDAPTYGLGEIFRPFHWGYLLFGTSYGLAFYWSARLVLLFLTAYEFFRIITRKNADEQTAGVTTPSRVVSERRGLAVLGASLVAFSTLVQWWFAVNNIAEMLIAVFASVVCFDHYLSTHNSWKRAGFAFLIAECAGMLLWSLYPAWMVPLAYVLVAVLIWQITSHWGTIKMRWLDWGIAAVVFALFAVITIAVAHSLADAIHAELNTAYPGKRVSLGGDSVTLTSLLGAAGSQFLYRFFIGLPETGHIAGFFPLGFLLAIVNMFGNKRGNRTDVLTVILMLESIFFAAFMVIGFPSWLARISLLSMCLTPRVAFGFELASLILLIRSIAMRDWSMSAGSALAISAVVAAYGAHFCERYTTMTLSPLTGIYVYLAPVVFFLEYFMLCMLGLYSPNADGGDSAFVVLNNRSSVAYRHLKAVGNGLCRAVSASGVAFVALVAIVTSMMINPIQRGTDSLHDEQAVLAAQSANAEKTGLFATIGSDGANSMYANLLAANGLSVVNTVQVTPHWNLWKALDPHGAHADAYNRYAYINFVISDGDDADTKFEVPYPDTVVVTVTPRQLHDLGVTYVTSDEDLADQTSEGWGFEKISEDGAVDLWELVPRS